MPELEHVATGKVRDLYAVDDQHLLLVASDRISTYDVVLPTPIPDKGRVLTGVSGFWFARTRHLVPNHLVSLGDDGRSLVCRRLEMLPVEFVVRGYLSGSGWADYRASGEVCGHVLPEGLVESDRLPFPIVTPATKAVEGHDLNISEDGGFEPLRPRRNTRPPAKPRSRCTRSVPSTRVRAASCWRTPSSSSESTTTEPSPWRTRR